LVVEDCLVELAEARGVGEDVNRDDFSVEDNLVGWTDVTNVDATPDTVNEVRLA
jgi:hypothetical protein